MPKPKPARQVCNLKQAAAALNVSTEVLRAAKNAGCLGFKSSRIDINLVGAFLKTFKPQPEPTGGIAEAKLRMERAKLKKLEAEADTKRLKADILKNQYLLKAAVENTVARCLGNVRSLLQQKLEREYPSAVAGLSVVEARIKGKALFDDICAEIRKLEEPWAV